MEVFRQRSLREVVDFCRERAKEKFKRYKKKAKWYWPELHLYCGVCKLRTGLYIRSTICLVFYVIATILNILMVYYIVARGRFLFSMDMSVLEEYFDGNLTAETFVQAKKIYTLILSYLIVWCVFKFIYILSLVSTIYAMYKKKPRILKIVLFNNTLNWILDVILSFFGAVLTQLFSKALVVFCILFEGYNILALASEYKQLKGKSKLLINLPITSVEVPSPTDGSDQLQEIRHNGFKHCETCSCIIEPMLPNTSEPRIVPSSSVTTAQCTPVEEEKQFNIKDVEIIFNQDQLLQQSSSVLENRNTRLYRPTVLELPPYNEEREIDIKKEKESDVPVIYDQNQLNICGSPVLESQEC
ncbi:PREDICTED: uncharacterized protein LOC106101516 [Papilio polytes]|uniref:uncharacterized protein LOC106101516 n=1 Tax=Papilio polytes TaxID=76194 RepID=UPI000675D20F|nr:PREDICTED: uncharacterized protein LOC106101516 [Papilio polytes]